MAYQAQTAAEAAERLSRRDSTLEQISIGDKELSDEELAELADCLLAHPNSLTALNLSGNRLTDETGVKLARCLPASPNLRWLNLSSNKFSEATYLAVAAALRVNSSLQYLYLYGNEAVDRTRIDAAFVEALQLNPSRPAESMWWLYSDSNDLMRLRTAACELGHPSLQLLLLLKSD